MKMKIVINVVLAQCILCYFRYFLQLTLGVYFAYFYCYLKKDSPYVDVNTHKETTIY